MQAERRKFLHVFRLGRDKNVADVIFKAIFSAYTIGSNETLMAGQKGKKNLKSNERESQQKLLKLAIIWDCLDGAKALLQEERKRKALQNATVRSQWEHPNLEVPDQNAELFDLALEQKKPTFIDYFLRIGFDLVKSSMQSGILKWYTHSYASYDETDYISLSILFDKDVPPTSFKELNLLYFKWIGSFMDEIYVIDKENPQPQQTELQEISDGKSTDYTIKLPEHYSNEEMLRDLFLWALFTTEIDLAKVFLLHLKSRICAALIATRLYKHFSEKAPNAFSREKLLEQAMEFEHYATNFVEVAVAGECSKFFATPCVDEVLNQMWYDKLALSNFVSKPLILVNLVTMGLFAYWWLPYRKVETQQRHLSVKNVFEFV
ncbi:unnamed protein product [Didymodactylos carnosus]|uniref:TRPM-like domain-containing protein n=1 Tax=Didymodactylos carnosus TaxID=1234261 RepID=A0A815NRJ3_9BILA|nr:unnamed protein product [Didymodactylos carnosus]CAF4313328.1 unnamed protein product [Didymodactylos carnosus]